MLYSSRHIQALYQISHETVRKWTLEFAKYLSDHATPTKNNQKRRYNDSDMQILSYIAQSRKMGAGYNDIHVGLANGERGEVPILPAEEVEKVTTSDKEIRLSLHIDKLENVILTAKSEAEQARKELQKLRKTEDENIQLRTRLEEHEKNLEKSTQRYEQIIEQYWEQLLEARNEITKLHDKNNQVYRDGFNDGFSKTNK